MHPLPLMSLDVLAVARDRAGEHRCVSLAMDMLKDIGVTCSMSEISNVYMKLEHAVPPVLPPMDRRKDFFVMPVPRTCSDCNAPLQLSPTWSRTRAFKFHVGFIRSAFQGSIVSPLRSSVLQRLELCKERRAQMSIGSIHGQRAVFSDHRSAKDEVSRICRCCHLQVVASACCTCEASFTAAAEMFHDFFEIDGQAPKNMRQELFRGWLLYESIEVLQEQGLTPLRSILWTLGRFENENSGPMWTALHDRLRHFLLEKHPRARQCPVCESALSVGFDRKESASVPLCAHPVGASVEVQELGWSLQFGCEQTCAKGFAFCSKHQPAYQTGNIELAPLQCPEGHDLECVTIHARTGSERDCDICGCSISEEGGRRKSKRGVKLWHCSAGCRYDVCDPCFVGVPPPPPVVMDESTPNPCNIQKKGKCHKRRRHGGVATGLLPCGIVANILPVAGHESATQIIAMLAEIRARRFFKYVIYDNGCMLSHFARNRARSSSSATMQQIAEMTFVIDRFHLKNHKECLDRNHSYFTPEFDIEKYPELKTVNTSLNEQWNSWIDVVIPSLGHTSGHTFKVYLVLLALLWNKIIVPRASILEEFRAPAPKRRQKRSRGFDQ